MKTSNESQTKAEKKTEKIESMTMTTTTTDSRTNDIIQRERRAESCWAIDGGVCGGAMANTHFCAI